MNRRKKTPTLAGLTAIAAASLISVSTARLALAEDPFLAANNTWITISGKVEAPKADSFMLNYGNGQVLVEMDDWDWYGEGYKLINGDEVSVSGWIDDDFFETTSIEASSVYVKDLGSVFFASGADEEAAVVAAAPITEPFTSVSGTVTEISGREFTLNTGNRKVTIDTNNMAYNPLDQEGYQQIAEGDVVRATGQMQNTFFDTRELAANSVITLASDAKKSANGGNQG